MSIGKKWAYGLGDIVSGFSSLVLHYVEGIAGTEFQLQSGHKLEVAIADAESLHDIGDQFDLSLFGNVVKTNDTPWLFETKLGERDSIDEVLPRNLGLLILENSSSVGNEAWANLHEHIVKKFNRGRPDVHYIVAKDTLLLMFGAYVIRIRDVY